MRRLFPVLALLVACSDSEPPLSTATSLSCPHPGALPFRLSSSDFQKSSNKTLVADHTQSKDESSDTLGNPSGVVASIYLADDQRPSAAAIGYHGVKARTTPTGGTTASALPGENVSLWTYDPAGTAWKSIGHGATGSDGSYDLPTGFAAANGQPVYAMLEADDSCAKHFDYLLAPGSKVVVTDIDGTLTTADAELFNQLSDETYVPKMMGAASELMKAWAAKGYTVIYLTARVHLFRAESRGWLSDLMFPDGPLITSNGTAADAGAYKTIWMKRMIQDFGWKVVAAYGNADTDIIAYEAAGVPKAVTFIVGPLAGNSGTTPIANNDFSAHIAGFVAAQPANQ